MSDQQQVIVMGGGPGGSTCAALLARAGVKVLLLEREVFPRYHIGESLLLSCVPILEMSGAIDRVAAAGFQVKKGAVFHWGADKWVVDWPSVVAPDARSWQVDRATFDHLLLRNAADNGVDVVEGATVKGVDFTEGRAAAVRWTSRDAPDTIHTTRCDLLVDATGRNGILSAKQLKNRWQHTVFQNTAVWSYWSGARLLPEAPEGAVHSLSTGDGWWWAIPLAGDRLSLGHVTHRSRFRERRPDYDSLSEYYTATVAGSPTIKWMTEHATRVDEVRAEQDYSYVAERFSGPGYVMIGDAACFLDPLLSTGVHLALFSALAASASIAAIIQGDATEDKALAYFEHTYRRAYARLIALVSQLYENYENKDDYFTTAQRLRTATSSAHPLIEAFVDISSGNTDMREVADHEVRVMTESLLQEGILLQADRRVAHGDIDVVNMSPLRDLWSMLDADSGGDDLRLVTTPCVGLRPAPVPIT